MRVDLFSFDLPEERIAPMLSFRSWVEAVFRGPDPEWEMTWDEEQIHPSWVLEHTARLFAAPGFLRHAYTAEELAGGLERLRDGWELTFALWERRVPWPVREACIRAMPGLFRDVLAHDPLEHTCFMWFETFRPFDDDADERAGLALAEAAAEILALPNEECQLAALHGLGHFDHPRRREWIESYLRDNRVDRGVRDYALRAAEGEVL